MSAIRRGACASLALPLLLTAAPALAGQAYLGEVEPNGTTGTASAIAGTNAVVRGFLFPNGDVDVYPFTATAGDRV